MSVKKKRNEAAPRGTKSVTTVSRTLTEVASSCALALLRFDMDMEVDDAPDELDRLKATSLFLRAAEACDALASDDALRPWMQRLLDV